MSSALLAINAKAIRALSGTFGARHFGETVGQRHHSQASTFSPACHRASPSSFFITYLWRHPSGAQVNPCGVGRGSLEMPVRQNARFTLSHVPLPMWYYKLALHTARSATSQGG